MGSTSGYTDALVPQRVCSQHQTMSERYQTMSRLRMECNILKAMSMPWYHTPVTASAQHKTNKDCIPSQSADLYRHIRRDYHWLVSGVPEGLLSGWPWVRRPHRRSPEEVRTSSWCGNLKTAGHVRDPRASIRPSSPITNRYSLVPIHGIFHQEILVSESRIIRFESQLKRRGKVAMVSRH